MTQVAHFSIPVWTQGDHLRKAREHAGLEQTELAAEIGVSRNTVINYERGRVKPRRHVIMAWAMRTGVPVEWLETGEAPSPDDEGTGLPVEYAPRDSNPEPSDSGIVLELVSVVERAAA